MFVLSVALAWDVDPFLLVRVEDPDHPDAIVASETGAVLAGPPDEGPWRWEPLAEPDSTPAFEALEATGVTPWHGLGATGAGVRVAVFDPGFVGASEGELGPFTALDCAAHRSCEIPYDPLRDGGGTHGTACAEVVRDMAPDVELFLVRTTSFTSFENGARWAMRNGIDVISMSMSFYGDSFVDGSGPFAPLIEELEAAGVLLVTSAGNNARQHWSGRWVDADLDGRMDFLGDNGLILDAPAGADRRVNLLWNQFRRCGDTDLDLVLRNADGDVVARSEARQIVGADGCQPVERARYDLPSDGPLRLEVHRVAGSVADLELDVLTRNGSLRDADPRGSVTVPADHPLVFAVGAVRADRYLTAPAEGFSSWGPTHAGVPKPDVAGPDRLSTEVSGAGGFTGTSAATPAVAGLIAVVMSSGDGHTAREAAEIVRRHALGDAALGESPDPALGAGRARLPGVAQEVGCGRRPTLLPLFLLPLGWRRVRWGR